MIYSNNFSNINIGYGDISDSSNDLPMLEYINQNPLNDSLLGVFFANIYVIIQLEEVDEMDFEPEELYNVRILESTTCPHCRLTVKSNGLYISEKEKVICPHCGNSFDGDSFILHEHIKVERSEKVPIKCLNCGFSFISTPDDFYYKPGNIKCPKCKIELSRKSVLNVYKNFKTPQYKSTSSNGSSYLFGCLLAFILVTIAIIMLIFGL